MSEKVQSHVQQLVANARDRKTVEALRRINVKTKFTAVEEKTPLEALLASDESPKCPHCGEGIEEPADLEHWLIKNETVRRVFEYFCQDGLGVDKVMRNVYAVGAHMGLPPWNELTVRDRGVIMGESHGTAHLVMKRTVNYLRKKGAKSFKAAGQKSVESGATYSETQKGNTNRKRKPRSRHRRLRTRQRKINGTHAHLRTCA